MPSPDIRFARPSADDLEELMMAGGTPFTEIDEVDLESVEAVLRNPESPPAELGKQLIDAIRRSLVVNFEEKEAETCADQRLMELARARLRPAA